MNKPRQTPHRRHSRAGGNPLVGLGLFELFLRFLRRKVDSRLRGNDGSQAEIYASMCKPAPSPVWRERAGERVALRAAPI